MALCLADSLITRGDFDPVDQLERFVRWYENGYLSSNGERFDIETTTLMALMWFKKTETATPAQKDETDTELINIFWYITGYMSSESDRSNSTDAGADGPLVCNECGGTGFKTSAELEEHNRKEHGKTY